MSPTPSLLRIVVALAIAAGCGIARAEYTVEVQAPDDLRGLLATHLEVVRYQKDALSPGELDRLVGTVAADARELLATQGYFSPKIDVRLDHQPAVPAIRVKVEPGPPAVVRRVDLEIGGDLVVGEHADPARLDAVQDAWPLRVGARFRQDAWDDAKSQFLRSLLIDRYPFARISESRAEVDPAANAVDLTVRVDSGPLARLGKLRIRGLKRYDEATVRNLKPFAEGEPFRQELLLEYQSRLQASGYFDSAVVALTDDFDDEGNVIVRVRVAEKTEKELRLGLGYSTNTKVRGSVEYTHNDVFDTDLRLVSLLKIESLAQSAQAALITPVNDKGYNYITSGRFAREDVQGLETVTGSASFGRERKRLTVDTLLVGSLLYERSRPSGGEETSTLVAAINYSWTYRAVDSLLLPTKGYMLNLQGGGGTPINRSESSSFARLYGKVAGFLPVGDDALIGRAELGRTFASTRKGIPQEFLFRTGGLGTVRGYDYQELGVREGDAVVGGRYLATASIEYVHMFVRDWGAAVFLDAGNAADSLKDLKPAYGYGVGARWRSPVGAIAVDLAYGEREEQWRIHFALGFTF